MKITNDGLGEGSKDRRFSRICGMPTLLSSSPVIGIARDEVNHLDMRTVIMTTALAINFDQFVTISNQQPVTTSLFVAQAFPKKIHKNILRAIDSLEIPDEFRKSNFIDRTYEISIGRGNARQSRYVEMTKDGFILLVMGFNGQQANLIKIGYINAFNKMAEILSQPQPQPTALLTKPHQQAIKDLVLGRVKNLPKEQQAGIIIKQF